MEMVFFIKHSFQMIILLKTSCRRTETGRHMSQTMSIRTSFINLTVITSSIKLLLLIADNGTFTYSDTCSQSLLAAQQEQPLGGPSRWFAQKLEAVLRLWRLQVAAQQVPGGPMLCQAACSNHCLPQYGLSCTTFVGASVC